MNKKCIYTKEDIDRALDILVGNQRLTDLSIDTLTLKEMEAVSIIILSIVNGEWTMKKAK